MSRIALTHPKVRLIGALPHVGGPARRRVCAGRVRCAGRLWGWMIDVHPTRHAMTATVAPTGAIPADRFQDAARSAGRLSAAQRTAHAVSPARSGRRRGPPRPPAAGHPGRRSGHLLDHPDTAHPVTLAALAGAGAGPCRAIASLIRYSMVMRFPCGPTVLVGVAQRIRKRCLLELEPGHQIRESPLHRHKPGPRVVRPPAPSNADPTCVHAGTCPRREDGTRSFGSRGHTRCRATRPRPAGVADPPHRRCRPVRRLGQPRRWCVPNARACGGAASWRSVRACFTDTCQRRTRQRPDRAC